MNEIFDVVDRNFSVVTLSGSRRMDERFDDCPILPIGNIYRQNLLMQWIDSVFVSPLLFSVASLPTASFHF